MVQFTEFGGGICNVIAESGPAVVEIGNTVLKRGFSGPNIVSAGKVTSHGYNVSDDNAGGFLNGPGDQINTDPILGPLQDNAGPTFTHALLPSSPAIDAGDPNLTPPPFYDQRGPGFWRVRNGRVDAGSFEVQQGTSPTPPLQRRPRRRPQLRRPKHRHLAHQRYRPQHQPDLCRHHGRV